MLYSDSIFYTDGGLTLFTSAVSGACFTQRSDLKVLNQGTAMLFHSHTTAAKFPHFLETGFSSF